MESQMTQATVPTAKTRANPLFWTMRFDLIYAVLGIAWCVTHAAPSAVLVSFSAGVLMAELNFELLKKISTLLIAIFRGDKPGGFVFYGLIVGKFALWGTVIMILSVTDWLQGQPFVIGVFALVIAGLSYGIREVLYARRTSRF